jgi:3-oxoisoapionate decarboxylase
MQAGIGSFAFGWALRRASPAFSEHDLLACAVSHGLQVVQLGDNLPVHTMPKGRLDALVAAACQANVAIELGARGLTEAHLERYLQLATRVGARLLRFVVDAEGHEPHPRETLSLLRNAASTIQASPIVLAIENHDRLPALALRRLIEDVGSSRIGVCLDTANSLGAGEGLSYVTDILASVTVNLHVKDVAISRLSHQMGFIVEGRPLGRGQLPILRTLERVHGEGRCGSVILESWTPRMRTLTATRLAEKEWVEVGIEALKNMVGGLRAAV